MTSKSVVTLASITFCLLGCDMRHAVRLELKEKLGANTDKFTVSDVMATLKPAIDKNELKCMDSHEHDKIFIKCRTWPYSFTSLKVFDKDATAQIVVDDESPIFFWTPQPYGRIRSDVINALKSKYGEDGLDCGQGISLRIHCSEWPKKNKK